MHGIGVGIQGESATGEMNLWEESVQDCGVRWWQEGEEEEVEQAVERARTERSLVQTGQQRLETSITGYVGPRGEVAGG